MMVTIDGRTITRKEFDEAVDRFYEELLEKGYSPEEIGPKLATMELLNRKLFGPRHVQS